LKPPKYKRACRACPLVKHGGDSAQNSACAYRIKAAESYLNSALRTTRFRGPDRPVIQKSCAQFLWIMLCTTIDRDFYSASAKAARHIEYYLYRSFFVLKTMVCAYIAEPARKTNL
jgi:hypothetical protein